MICVNAKLSNNNFYPKLALWLLNGTFGFLYSSDQVFMLASMAFSSLEAGKIMVSMHLATLNSSIIKIREEDVIGQLLHTSPLM